jgi:hypothetical protein
MGAAPGRARLNRRDGQDALTARRYAQHLLDVLSAAPPCAPEPPDEHPALAWARTGLMALTGAADGAPQMCPVPLTACADGALAALAALAPVGALEGLRGSDLLAERAVFMGHTRNGRIAPGGSCRLLDTVDGVVALNLARNDDWSLLPAWLEDDVAPDWDSVARAIRQCSAQALVERGRELGLAVADASSPSPRTGVSAANARSAWGGGVRGNGGKRTDPLRAQGGDKPLVVDLSSLWAGPLCSRLLLRCGAEVVKIESRQRPDGARRGSPAFFERLNAGKCSVSLDFSSTAGRAELRAWLQRADIVIEGSRPRALRQLGIHAEELVAANPGLTWISLTGYGRTPQTENGIAYGDDAAVAAGLSQIQYYATGEWMFVGDALADPLTGLHAALAAWAGWRAGGAGLVSLALCDVVRQCMAFDLPATPAAIRERQREWTEIAKTALWRRGHGCDHIPARSA